MVKAVLAADAEDVVDAVQRAEAVKQVLHMPEFQAIGAACKRMRNILRQAAEKGIAPAATVRRACRIPRPKRRIWQLMSRSMARRSKSFARRKNTARRCMLLSTAREPVDAFFDKVMVMVEDAQAARKPLGVAADVVERVFHDRGFFGDRDRRQDLELSPSGAEARLLELSQR